MGWESWSFLLLLLHFGGLHFTVAYYGTICLCTPPLSFPPVDPSLTTEVTPGLSNPLSLRLPSLAAHLISISDDTCLGHSHGKLGGVWLTATSLICLAGQPVPQGQWERRWSRSSSWGQFTPTPRVTGWLMIVVPTCYPCTPKVYI